MNRVAESRYENFIFRLFRRCYCLETPHVLHYLIILKALDKPNVKASFQFNMDNLTMSDTEFFDLFFGASAKNTIINNNTNDTNTITESVQPSHGE